MQRTQGLALAGLRGKEDPSSAALRPIRSQSNDSRPSLSVGSIRRLSAIKPSEARTPLRCCCAPFAIIIAISVFLDAAVDLVGVRHPLAPSSCGVGPKVSRWAKIFCGVSVKNSPFLSVVGWYRDAAMALASARRRSSSDWPPIGAARVQRIQNDVAAIRVIESLHELAGRVVHDGRMAALLDLHEELHDQRWTCPRRCRP